MKTVDDVVRAGACYERDKILALWAGREALSAREISELDIPPGDIVWALDNLWPEARPKALEKIVTRAITNNLGKSGVPAWEGWAARWLSGEDRSKESAEEAAESAEAEAGLMETWAVWMAATWAARVARAAGATRATGVTWAAARTTVERKLQIADYLEEIEK